jgi:hypothetical protein
MDSQLIMSSAVEFIEAEEDGWHNLKPLWVQFQDHTHMTVLLKFVESRLLTSCCVSIWQGLRNNEQEVTECEVTLLKGLNTARKYMWQFDAENNIM